MLKKKFKKIKEIQIIKNDEDFDSIEEEMYSLGYLKGKQIFIKTKNDFLSDKNNKKEEVSKLIINHKKWEFLIGLDETIEILKKKYQEKDEFGIVEKEMRKQWVLGIRDGFDDEKFESD